VLKGIPPVLSPELLAVLRSMGHGDELVLADGNFPAAACASRLIRIDGQAMPGLLEAILTLLPLDDYTEFPAAVMSVVPGDTVVPTIWETYRRLIHVHEDRDIKLEEIGRQAFYERARRAYAIVATGETAQYANLILVKGVVRPSPIPTKDGNDLQSGSEGGAGR
jgi:L-fucose mutarotase